MRRYHREPERRFDLAAGKAALAMAFAAMRKLGLIALQNFSCCGSCAGYAIATRVGAMPEAKRLKVKGTAFYHRQDNDRLVERGEFYVAFGSLHVSGIGEVGEPTVWVGEQAARILREAGLEVEWDGNPDTRLLVRLPGIYMCQAYRCRQDAEVTLLVKGEVKRLCQACASTALAFEQAEVR